MKRAHNHKHLACTGCAEPQRVGAEALRVLCGTCVLNGQTFPRAVQTNLSLGETASSTTHHQHHHHA